MKKLFALIAGSLLLGASMAQAAAPATVINFDDLQSNAPVPSNYADLTWGTTTDSTVASHEGYFYTLNDTGYGTPHSGANFVRNDWGPNNLWFSFSTPITFNGAWFATARGANGSGQATQVRFRDDLGATSSWLTLAAAPQYLAADFKDAQKIYVERRGAQWNYQWYTMDDVSYTAAPPVPEPSTYALFSLGLGGLALWKRRQRR